jgi:hypothetical protein
MFIPADAGRLATSRRTLAVVEVDLQALAAKVVGDGARFAVGVPVSEEV